MQLHILPLILLFLSLTSTSSHAQLTPTPAPPNNDGESLLKFKSKADPTNKLLYTATEHYLDFCHWQGVKCHAGRVVRFSLLNLPLRGTFPPNSLSNLGTLRVLVLRNTSLWGPLPPLDFSSLLSLHSLILPRNNFSGPFPPSLSLLRNLRVLDLSFNSFSGSVPAELSTFSQLTTLKLQFNSFSGALPPLNQSSLGFFNVSFNDFSGEIPPTVLLSNFQPSAFSANPNLCGDVIHKPCASINSSDSASDAAATTPSTIPSPPPKKSHRKQKILIILLSTFAGISLLCVLLSATKKNHRKRRNTGGNGRGEFQLTAVGPAEVIRETLHTQSNELKEIVEGGKLAVGRRENAKRGGGEDLVFCSGERKMYTLDMLMRGSAEVLGKGTVGTTYKTRLEENQLILTVKRLDAKKMCGVHGEVFEKYMDVVGGLRHPNLVPVRAYFQANEDRLVIFYYLPNGSVFNLLHGSRSTRAKPLHWTICLKIAEDVAQGLAYIHQESKLIHGNLKASNVLLGKDFEACITDYCLATLATSSDNEDPNSARYKGPETRQSGWWPTHKTDVYAFGVLLLELLSGKPPSEHPFLAPPDMPDWVKAMRGVDDDFEESQLGMLVDVSCSCSLTSPELRPTMWQALKMIQKISPDDAVDPSKGSHRCFE